jgi:hypothetical protein
MVFQWSQENQESWTIIQRFVGQSIKKVELNYYTHDSEEDYSDTPLQITSTEGAILFLKNSSDGESLKAIGDPWIDPFSGEMNGENCSYVDDAGKWIQRDVSTEVPFKEIIEKTIVEINPVFNHFGKLCGVQFKTGSTTFTFIVSFDECHMVWEDGNPVLEKLGCIVIKPLFS